MNGKPDSTLEADLQLAEKLHKLGDDTGAILVARRLLMAHTLSPEEKRRIKKVIDGTKPGLFTKETVIVVVVVIVVLYIYLQFS